MRTWALVGEEEIDGNWATRVKAALEGLGLELAGVITGDCRPDLVLSEMLRLMASCGGPVPDGWFPVPPGSRRP